jgi:hypothetical protein
MCEAIGFSNEVEEIEREESGSHAHLTQPVNAWNGEDGRRV